MNPKQKFRPFIPPPQKNLLDHGKTTLVDAMLQQSSVFRDNEQVRRGGASTVGWVCHVCLVKLLWRETFFSALPILLIGVGWLETPPLAAISSLWCDLAVWLGLYVLSILRSRSTSQHPFFTTCVHSFGMT